MKAVNSLQELRDKPKFSVDVTGKGLQRMIEKATPTPEAAARVTSTLLQAASANEAIKNCTAATVAACVLRGEGYGLVYGQGYYAVPYGDSCNFIISYKGLLQLAIATGELADIDVVPVREGELVGKSPKNKKPVFNFDVYKTEEEEKKHPVIGYMGYFEKKDGFYRSEYWSVDDILAHGFRYSAAFKEETYRKLISGELSEKEMEKLKKSSPWYDIGGNQETMMKKTVLRSMLNSGYLALANNAVQRAMEDDGHTMNVNDDGVVFVQDDIPVKEDNKEEEQTVETIQDGKQIQEAVEADTDDGFFD